MKHFWLSKIGANQRFFNVFSRLASSRPTTQHADSLIAKAKNFRHWHRFCLWWSAFFKKL